MNFFQGKGDSRVQSNFFGGEGGGGQSRDQGPESRVYSPGSRVHYNCDRKILESCLLGCQKVAKELPKIQEVVT